MKPTFALNLSNERVALLHRTGRGWLQIGDVAFDTPDLSEALAYLRKTALGLSPRGVSTKLVIPNSEILYCDVEAPGPDDDTRRTQIRAGLAGRTPYAPEDLVFDWRGKGTMVKVAVVARQTLVEAEAFAVEHRFGPVSFVALPDPSQFKGEPFFGPTEAAKTSLTKGDTVEPDRDAMAIVTRDLPLAELAPEPEERPARRSERSERPNSDPLAGAVEKMRSSGQMDANVMAADPAPAPTAPVSAAAEQSTIDVARTPADPDLAPIPDPVVAKPEPVSEKTASVADPMIDEAPFTEVIDTLPPGSEPPASDASVSGPSISGSRRDDVLDDLPPAPSPAAQMAFASRRAPEEFARDPGADPRGSRERPSGDLPGAARADPVKRAVPPPVRNDAQVTAPSIPGSKKPRKAGSATPPPAVAAAAAALAASGASMGKPTKPLTRPGGTFGAKPLPKRGKPRFLGLILTVILLVVLALIAAWATFSEEVRNDTESATDVAALAPDATDEPTTVDDEIAADQQDAPISSDAASTAVSDVAEPAGADLPAEELVNDEVAAPSADPLAVAEDEAAADGEPTATMDVPTTADVPVAAAAPVDAAVPVDANSESAATPEIAESDPATTPSTQIAAAESDATPSTTLADPANPDLTVAGSEATPDAAVNDPAPTTETVVAPPAPVPPTPAPDVGLADNVAAPEPRTVEQQTDEVFLASGDTAPSFQDALQLPDPAFAPDALPAAAPPPPPFGTVYQFDAAGLIIPTPQGILSPEGFMLFAGPPPVTPPERSPVVAAAATAVVPAADPAADAEAASLAATAAASLAAPAVAPQAAPADPAMAGFRPRPRPETPNIPAAAENADDASMTPELGTAFADLRPRARPATSPEADAGSLVVAGSAASSEASAGTPRARPETVVVAGATARDETAAASLTAQSNAAVEAALASAAETGNIMTLAVSRRPAARPLDMSRAVNAAIAAAVRAPEPEAEPQVAGNNAALPEDDEEPELASAAPRIPTKTTVAKQATFSNAINLSKINLIGVYGTPSKRYALIRLATGRYKKVSVGDTVDGGRVEAITASEVRYQKSGRLISLKMPRA